MTRQETMTELHTTHTASEQMLELGKAWEQGYSASRPPDVSHMIGVPRPSCVSPLFRFHTACKLSWAATMTKRKNFVAVGVGVADKIAKNDRSQIWWFLAVFNHCWMLCCWRKVKVRLSCWNVLLFMFIPYRGKFLRGRNFAIFAIECQVAKICSRENFFSENFCLTSWES